MVNTEQLIHQFVINRSLERKEVMVLDAVGPGLFEKLTAARRRLIIAELLTAGIIEPEGVQRATALIDDFCNYVQALNTVDANPVRRDGLTEEELPVDMAIMLHEFLEDRNRASNDHYEERLHRFGLYLAQRHDLKDFRTAAKKHFAAYQSWQRKIGNSAATIHHDYRHIRSFYNFLIDVYPDQTPLRPHMLRSAEPIRPQTPARYLGDAELHRLLNHTRRLPMDNIWSFRDRMVVSLLLEVGARAAEIQNLTTQDVLDNGGQTLTLFLKGKGSKQRYVALGTKASKELVLYMKKRADFLGGGDGHLFFSSRRRGKTYPTLVPNTLYQLMTRLCKAAGIERPVGSHLLRHTSGRIRKKHGMPISALQDTLGHAEKSTTYLYTRFRGADVNKMELATSPLDHLPDAG